MASLIGIPLYMDQATAKGERLAYARCFIEINAAVKLPKTVQVEVSKGEYVDIPVEFEWVPPICSKCKSFGHNEVQCTTIEMWVPKKTTVSNSAEQSSPSNDGETTTTDGDINRVNGEFDSSSQDQDVFLSKDDSHNARATEGEDSLLDDIADTISLEKEIEMEATDADVIILGMTSELTSNDNEAHNQDLIDQAQSKLVEQAQSKLVIHNQSHQGDIISNEEAVFPISSTVPIAGTVTVGACSVSGKPNIVAAKITSGAASVAATAISGLHEESTDSATAISGFNEESTVGAHTQIAISELDCQNNLKAGEIGTNKVSGEDLIADKGTSRFCEAIPDGACSLTAISELVVAATDLAERQPISGVSIAYNSQTGKAFSDEVPGLKKSEGQNNIDSNLNTKSSSRDKQHD
jgi:hypothetical protein